jgi:hypothetical protein
MSARRRFRGWLWDEGGAVKVYAVIYDPPDRHGPFVHWYRRKSHAKGHKRGDPQHLIVRKIHVPTRRKKLLRWLQAAITNFECY